MFTVHSHNIQVIASRFPSVDKQIEGGTCTPWNTTQPFTKKNNVVWDNTDLEITKLSETN